MRTVEGETCLKAQSSRSDRLKGGTRTLSPWSRAGKGSFGTKSTDTGLEAKSPEFKAQIF
jgi:hypothetical protein